MNNLHLLALSWQELSSVVFILKILAQSLKFYLAKQCFLCMNTSDQRRNRYPLKWEDQFSIPGLI